MHYLILFINIFCLIRTNNNFLLPFYHMSFSKNDNENNFFKKLFLSQIVTKTEIGSKKTIFYSSFKLQSYYTYILGNNLRKDQYKKLSKNIQYFFDYNLSDTYESIKEEKFNYEHFYFANKSKDNLFFSDLNYELNPFKFYLVKIINEDDYQNEIQNTFSIGLGVKFLDENNNDEPEKNNNDDQYLERKESIYFIHQLKKKKLIDYETFYFKFYNKNLFNDKGEIVFGAKVIDNKFDYIKASVVIDKLDKLKWSFVFDNIYIGNKNLNISQLALIKSEQDLILGSEDYFKEIKKNFFDKYLLNKKCEIIESFINDDLIIRGIVCDNDIDFSTFESISFEIKEINSNFTFNSKDLFYNYQNKKYFLIVFNKYYSSYWIFGRLFLKKYQILFDFDKKILAIEKNIINNKNLINYKFIFVILIIVIISILLIIIFEFLWKNKRKSRKNEINDNFEYKLKNENINSISNYFELTK